MTLNKALDDGITTSVDVYVSPIFTENEGTDWKVAPSVTISTTTKDVALGASENAVWYEGSGKYMILACDGGSECMGGYNTNSIIFEII